MAVSCRVGQAASAVVGHDEIGGGEVGPEEPGEADGGERHRRPARRRRRARCRRDAGEVSVSVRPTVTAGLAKLVDDVNQYAAAM